VGGWGGPVSATAAGQEDALTGPAAAGTPPFEQRLLRNVLGHFCTGITVITALLDDAPVGFACQSFQSLSLDPPLVSFSPSRASNTWPRIRAAGRFAVNVLTHDQELLSQSFATSGGDKFQGVGWTTSPAGSPVLDDVLAWVDCVIEDVYEAGDHQIVLGRVLNLAAGDGEPLIFFQGRYHRLALSL
jgi:3-hydroxy-9,10-secoandrosta-1,3,5(10)-triene-9,17-dione monooxygenase reductase component